MAARSEGSSLSLAVQYGADVASWLPRWRVRRWVSAALSGPARLTVRFVGQAEGRRLNRAYRGQDHATNVLTFGYAATPQVQADIVLCVPVLLREARLQRKPPLAHAAHLVVHGVLHARGMDHQRARQAKCMEREEARVLARFGVPDPYAEPTGVR